MSRTKYVAALSLIAIVGAAFVASRATSPRFGADEHWRLKVGMTLEEASAVLGAPPGDYYGWGGLSPFDRHRILNRVPNRNLREGLQVERWLSPDVSISVHFDDGRLIEADLVTLENNSFHDRLSNVADSVARWFSR